MKILFANTLSAVNGGAERVVYDTAVELIRRGHQAALLVAYDDRRAKNPETWPASVNRYYVPELIRPVTDRRAYAAYRRGAQYAGGLRYVQDILDIEAPDVVHVHNFPSVEVFADLRVEMPMVRTVHSYESLCESRTRRLPGGEICTHPMGEACRRLCGFEDSFRSVRTRAENRFMMERFARLLPVSDYVRDVMVGNGFDPAGLRVARNFTRVAPVTAAVDPNRVLFVGRPTPEKGLLELVRAVGRTSAKPVLHIVGGGSAAWSGPYLGEVASEASRLGVRVERQDWCVGAELALAYARSSVVAFPSVWPEPFGLVGIEAMAHGKPVVAFSCGGVREWAGPETAFTHPVGDIGAFAGSLDRLLGDRSLRERMGEAARAEAARRFSADAYMDRLLGLYAEVVNGSGERNGESTADRSRRRPALRYA